MKKWKIAIWIVAPVLALWLLTGGLRVARYDWILPDRGSYTGYRPLVLLDFPPNFRTDGVPFLYTYTTQTAPFDLKVIYITHNTVPDPELHVDKLTVEYEDGTVVDLTERVHGQLKPVPAEHWYIDDNHVNQKKPSMQATYTISNCMPKRKAFVLRVATRLLSRGQVVETFDSPIRYNYYSEHSIMTTWWYLLLSA